MRDRWNGEDRQGYPKTIALGFASDRVLSRVDIAWLTGSWVVRVEACFVLSNECHRGAVGCFSNDLIGVGFESVDPGADRVGLLGPLPKRSFECGG